MKYFFSFWFLCLSSFILAQDTATEKFPVITFEEQTIDLGTLIKGEAKDMAFQFTNTGNDTLVIELVTACKCTKLDWPQEPIPPGQNGTISVTYDSTNQEPREFTKTVDIICNTDPIVVEAFFKVKVESKE